ncbi:MAG: DMT family transporter [Gaiellales bacterium]|nr:DMT family transporter [Gaiellales bacterium]
MTEGSAPSAAIPEPDGAPAAAGTLSSGTASRHLTPGAAAALAGICLLWGVNVVMMKISTEGFPPALTAGLRNLVAAVIFAVVLLAMRQPVFHRDRRLRDGIVIGVLFGLDFLFMYTGLPHTNASRAVIFMYTHPIWVALGAHFLFSYDRLTWRRVLGLALALGGIISVFGTRTGDLPAGYVLGDLMQLGCAVFWAATTLYIKRMSESYEISAVHVLFYQLVFSIPLLLLASLLFERGFAINITAAVGWSLAYQTFIIASASYLVWYWMVTHYHVTNLVVFSMLTPIFGVLAGAVVLGEHVSGWLLVGLGLVLGGIYLVAARSRKTGAAVPSHVESQP